MSRLSIIKRSHSFIATTQYRNVAHTLQKFAERYEEWEWKKAGKGQKAQRTLIKSYHVTNDSRSTYSFHINAFDDFIKYLEWVGVEKSLYDVTTAPMYEPEKIDIKIVSPYSPTEEQVPLIKYLKEPGKTKILTLQTGMGKGLVKGQVVLIDGKWVKIEDVKVGDLANTPKGKLVKVKGWYPQGVSKAVEVEFEDGRTSKCDLNHLWSVFINGLEKIVNTMELLKFIEDGFDIAIPLIDVPTDQTKHLDIVEELTGSREIKDFTFTSRNDLVDDLQHTYHALGYISEIIRDGDNPRHKTVTVKRPADGRMRIVSITPLEEVETYCIELDDEERLFITNDFIVTHNTYSFLQGFAGISERCALILPAKYVERWVGDLTGDGQVVDLKEEDLVIVKGAAEFARQVAIAKAGEFKAKMMIFSSTTFQIYLKAFATDPVAAMKEYGCQPSKVMELFKIGVLGRDEVHELFHFNFLVDLNVHVPKTISLSATVDFDNPMTNKMCALMFPKSEQVFNGEWKKYINAVGLFWKLHKPNLVKTTLNGGYNHGAFETSIIKNKHLLNAYLDMIVDMVDSIFSRFDSDDRMIIFAYTVNMCTLITERLKERYSDLEGGGVERYVGEDDYEILNTGRIIVSTLKSSGTAVDISKLAAVLMTTAIYSTQSNVQALGRLRQMKHKPHRRPEFYYLICKDIDKHVEYHKAKIKQFDNKVLSHETKNTHYAI